MASNGVPDLVAIVGMGLSLMVMPHHADAQTPLGRRRTYHALAAALGALLLTPAQPLPPGDPPLLRRIVPGLAEGLARLPPFLRDTALSLHLRTFYFNRLNPDDTQNEAWALGG